MIRPALGVFLALFVCVGISQGQPTTRPATDGNRPGPMIQRLEAVLQELNLSDDQMSRIRAILDEARTQMREMMGEMGQMEPDQRQAKLREYLSGLREKVAAELNEKQKALLAEKMPMLGTRRGDGAGIGGGGMLERLQQAINEMELTDQQKADVRRILGESREKLQAVREKAQSGATAEELREEARQIFSEAREELSHVLTSEQQSKLQELMGGRRGNEAPPQRPRPNRENPQRTDPPMEQMNPPERPRDEQPQAQQAQPPAEAEPAKQLRAGEAAPEFDLQRLDGKNVQLSSFKGKVLVLVFGSASSPSFRERAAALDQLAKQYGTKASFLVVYTREAHPAGEWEVERNKDDKISIQKHQNITERLERAKETRSALRLSIPFVVDTMDDKTFSDYTALQNSAFVIGKTGVIVARQSWFDPTGIRRDIDEAMRDNITDAKVETAHIAHVACPFAPGAASCQPLQLQFDLTASRESIVKILAIYLPSSR